MANIIDAPKTHLDNTVQVFDQFYNFKLVVPADQYDVIFTYFQSVCESKSIARNFTTIFFRIASITQENPLTLLEYISGKNKLETNALMIYYLNSMKSKTTLYGISNLPVPNEPIRRNVVI